MQWTVDNLDSGGGLMTNKNKCLVSESDGDVCVGTIPLLAGSLMGEAGKVPFAGSRRVLATAVDDWSGKPYCVCS